MTALVQYFSNHDLLNSRLLAYCNRFSSFRYSLSSSRHEGQFYDQHTMFDPSINKLQCLPVSEGYTFNLTSIPDLQSSPKAAEWQREAQGAYFIRGAWPVPVRKPCCYETDCVFQTPDLDSSFTAIPERPTLPPAFPQLFPCLYLRQQGRGSV